jgi:hypothetical protein
VKLVRLYNLTEAGTLNSPTAEPRKKKSFFKHANGGAQSDDEEDDGDELGPDMDYEDPAPQEPEDNEPPPPAKPQKEPEKEVPFTAQPAKPSPALQGGKTAGSVVADKATLGALQRALENVRTRDDDLQDWIDDVIREISRAMKSGGELTLPKFEETPDLDSFDDDDGGYEDEDF